VNAGVAGATLSVTGLESVSARNITMNTTCKADENGNFSFVLPYGTYTVSATTAAGSFEGKVTSNSATCAVTLVENKIAEIAAVTLSGAVRASATPTDAVYSNGGKTVAFSGVSTGAQQIYTLKNTVGRSFTYETTITGKSSQLVGACVTCGAEQISVMFAYWENNNVIIQANNHAAGGNDFVLKGVDDVIDADRNINAKVKFVQNGTSSLEIYVNDKLVCTITSAGFALGEGISYLNDAAKAAAEAKDGWNKIGDKAPKYLTRGEFACGFTGYMRADDKVSYTVSFTKTA
jgi:hypothetical protein